MQGGAIGLVLASLAAGVASLTPATAIAQAVSNMPPPVGIQSATPLTTGPAGPAGIPLGSTEIAVPGVSPIVPSQAGGMAACTGSGSATPRLFDGGGLSGSTSCSTGGAANSAVTSSSPVRRTGIPLGATEIGSAGLSPVAPTAAPGLPINAAPASGNP
jgi:hypothetical protein